MLPINLATALCLSNARPLTIAFAQASVKEAAARLQGAEVLWLPNLNVGTDYYRHDGTDQSTDGTIILDDKYAFAAGGGATLDFGVTDAIFRPLADRQVLAARESDVQAARNDALLAVAAGLFRRAAGPRHAWPARWTRWTRPRCWSAKRRALRGGLVAESKWTGPARCCSICSSKSPAARANWRIASARLTRVLRLKPRRGGRPHGAAASSSVADLAWISRSPIWFRSA